ncbi:uncharacterized protein LOC143299668 [Babylonia areolata]|uniref:uncharacterized protein LOC143299668 n=1 Tax=Babylonia areolata TaxID=304850 RepID=UPI003FCFA683
MTTEGGDDDVARQLQPHLSPARQGGPSAAVQASDVNIAVGNNGSGDTETVGAQRNWETFDEDAVVKPEQPASEGGVPVSRTQHPRSTSNEPGSATANGGTAMGLEPGAASQPSVAFSNRSGEVVMTGEGVTQGPVIQTRHMEEGKIHEMDRPLQPRRIRMLKIMSVVAAIFFFPTGIPAVYYAWRVPGLLAEGVMRGNIDCALRAARFSQRFVVLSAVLFVIIAVLVVAVVASEKADFRYVAHSSAHG